MLTTGMMIFGICDKLFFPVLCIYVKYRFKLILASKFNSDGETTSTRGKHDDDKQISYCEYLQVCYKIKWTQTYIFQIFLTFLIRFAKEEAEVQIAAMTFLHKMHKMPCA